MPRARNYVAAVMPRFRFWAMPSSQSVRALSMAPSTVTATDPVSQAFCAAPTAARGIGASPNAYWAFSRCASRPPSRRRTSVCCTPLQSSGMLIGVSSERSRGRRRPVCRFTLGYPHQCGTEATLGLDDNDVMLPSCICAILSVKFKMALPVDGLISLAIPASDSDSVHADVRS